MDIHNYIEIFDDGTVRQKHPITNEIVWAVPKRAKRSKLTKAVDTRTEKLDTLQLEENCSFCESNLHETSVEKFRITDNEVLLYNILPHSFYTTKAMVRCVSNLFPIVAFTYWKEKYGIQLTERQKENQRHYLENKQGYKHVESVVRYKLLQETGRENKPSKEDVWRESEIFFGSTHDVIIARKHYYQKENSQTLNSPKFLSQKEHLLYCMAAKINAKEIYNSNPKVQYVSIFQNFGKKAGASFDHLHKQVIGIDQYGEYINSCLKFMSSGNNRYDEYLEMMSRDKKLFIAENKKAVAFVGLGHQYPCIEIYSKTYQGSIDCMEDDSFEGLCTLLHKIWKHLPDDIHCNEEWHHTPPDIQDRHFIPVHIHLKIRSAVPAGFEGSTGIYVTTLTPYELQNMIVSSMEY